jgi:manganese/zinc/iron transport system permease protein
MTFLQIDLPAMTLAILAGLTAALVGNLLILRRQALMGDALSHMVLPGIVGGYVISGHPKSWTIVGGALLAGLLGAGLISLIQRLGRLDAATAMGVVLTTMFAAGVLLIELINISGIHLDIEHALYGSLESVIWLYPVGWKDIFNPAGWADLPREIPFIAGTFFTLSLRKR